MFLHLDSETLLASCAAWWLGYLCLLMAGQVIQGLYIGSAWAEMNKAALEKAGITDILQVSRVQLPAAC